MAVQTYHNNSECFNMTRRVESTLAIGFILDKVKSRTIFIPIVVGIIVIALNSLQLWTLRNKFQNELNSLFIVLQWLCWGDLLNAIFFLAFFITGCLSLKLFEENQQFRDLFVIVSRFLMATTTFVSGICLDYLAVIKMLKVSVRIPLGYLYTAFLNPIHVQNDTQLLNGLFRFLFIRTKFSKNYETLNFERGNFSL